MRITRSFRWPAPISHFVWFALLAAGLVTGIHAGTSVMGKAMAALGFELITLAASNHYNNLGPSDKASWDPTKISTVGLALPAGTYSGVLNVQAQAL